MDLIRVNDAYMATNGGLGIGAAVASDVNQIRNRFSLFKDFIKI